ncbi:MAG: IS66 family transposase, partial [Planctomycetes bacterium]|nr:IS66 family transposase [Planctomycetota bacterium]
KGYLWVRQNLRGEVLFRYHPSRGSAAAAEYLSEFDGWLQVDGYAGYDFLFRKPGGPVEVGCWAHARRKFYDTKDDHPLETDYVLKRIQELYEVEQSIRERKLKRKAIEKERKEKSAPILKNLHDWMLQHEGKLSPDDKLEEAIFYTLSRWTALNQYVSEGALDMDNNPIERSIRQVAVGRKNWLFAGSENGAHNCAFMYSLIITCRNLKINPYEYLKDVIARVKDHPADRMVDLTPRFWIRSHPGAVVA